MQEPANGTDERLDVLIDLQTQLLAILTELGKHIVAQHQFLIATTPKRK
jgi:hypothetical protein